MSREFRKLGGLADTFDIAEGPQFDLARSIVVGKIVRDVKCGRYTAVMAGVPCTSFSCARDRSGVIRTQRLPWGVSGLDSADQLRIATGNKTARAALRILRACISVGCGFVVENPWSSRLWLVPEIRRLLLCDDVSLIRADMCQHGTRWRKATGLLIYDPLGLDKAGLSCVCGGEEGICGRTSRKHIILEGTAPGGARWTRVAQTYPLQFARCAASYLFSQTL